MSSLVLVATLATAVPVVLATIKIRQPGANGVGFQYKPGKALSCAIRGSGSCRRSKLYIPSDFNMKFRQQFTAHVMDNESLNPSHPIRKQLHCKLSELVHKALLQTSLS